MPRDPVISGSLWFGSGVRAVEAFPLWTTPIPLTTFDGRSVPASGNNNVGCSLRGEEICPTDGRQRCPSARRLLWKATG